MSNMDPRWGDWAEKPGPIAETEIVSRSKCDVLILGAGISGMACALRAAQKGLKVAVMEKNAKWSARGGNIGVSGSAYMKSLGYENDIPAMVREWIKRCGNRCDEQLVWLYFNKSPEAMDWLLDIVTAPEYGARPELQACIYKGETYRENFGSHRLFDGPMAKKGLRPGAADAVYAMYCEALKLGAEFMFNCSACSLLQENGRVVGAVGKTAEGYVSVKSATGVVIATGDIGGNDEMCADLAPLANRCPKIYSPAGCNTGDGHRLGLWAGGVLENGPFPLMLHPQAYFFANFCFLFVDRKGRRFMNEDNYIQGKCNLLLSRGESYAWSIIDSAWPEKVPATLPYGGGIFWDIDHGPDDCEFPTEKFSGMLERGLRAGTVVCADSLKELAEKMGVPAWDFEAAVQRYRAMVASGRDEDFGKRSELLIDIDKPPYYALKFGPAVLAVVGGLRVDAGMHVLDENSDQIAGLYAIGNAAGGRYGVDYPMLIPGNSHGTALTFGYLLGGYLAEAKNASSRAL
ncbi:MAG: FAD-dependent oxidoreductase [Ruminococcaceae bacterium]|nr:FAD-dependent oxidoreductase [Oscillospiraceae bacterium]